MPERDHYLIYSQNISAKLTGNLSRNPVPINLVLFVYLLSGFLSGIFRVHSVCTQSGPKFWQNAYTVFQYKTLSSKLSHEI